jgi:tetratricopeptide (TPR) repeat protein
MIRAETPPATPQPRRAVVQNPPPQPTTAGLSPERRAEITDLYRRGMAAVQTDRRDDAVRYWELVWSAAPDFQRVGEHLKREYLVRGMESFAANDVDGAVRDWEKALAIDPDDARARGYLARAYEQRARIDKIRSETP